MLKLAGTVAAIVFAAPGLATPSWANDWTQGYVAIGLGVDALTGEGVATFPTGEQLAGSGAIGGNLGASVTIGADYQHGRYVVVGGFVSYDWSNIDTTVSVVQGANLARAHLLDLGHVWTVGGRAGALVIPSTLIYGLIGYSWMDFDDSPFAVRFGPTSISGTATQPQGEGVTFGGGLEHKLHENVAVRAEYRFTDFGEQAISTVQGVSLLGETQSHIFRVGAAYQLGLGGHAPDNGAAPVTRDWSGAYLGAGLGIEAFVRDLDSRSSPGGGIQDTVVDLDGIGGGDIAGVVLVGYDHNITARIVAGLAGYFEWANKGFTLNASAFGNTASARLMGLDEGWTLAGRLGYLLTDDTLGYGLLGYTRAEMDDLQVALNATSVTVSGPKFNGVTVGGGFEHRIMERISVRGEYRYTNLGGEAISASFNNVLTSMTIDPSIHSGSLIAAYRFN